MRAKYLIITATVLGCLAGCKSPPRFHRTTLLETIYDADNAATRVAVSFEAMDPRGLPISGLTAENITILEDGVPATSESHTRLEQTRHPIRIAFVLDRSQSVRNDKTIANVKATAQSLIDALAEHPCEVQIYSFASSVQQLPSLGQLATSPTANAESRWTALYHAVNTVLIEGGLPAHRFGETPPAQPGGEVEVRVEPAMVQNPPTILVICTDGADNYSQNFDAPTLVELEKLIAANHVVVHAVGFGGVEHEQDRQGIFGADALRRLAVHGSFHHATDPETIANIADRITQRIRATYSCVFYSPSLEGEHELTIEIDWNGSKGRSTPIRFTASR